MDYGSKAGSISSSSSTFRSCINGVSSSNFNGFWSGNAHDNLTGQLDTALSGFKEVMNQVSSFSSAVSKLGEYKKCKERVEEIDSEVSNLDSVKDSSRIQSLKAEKEDKLSDMKELKAKIEAILSEITAYESQVTKISYSG